MWMSSSGTIKTMCYDWASWAVKGIDFHLPPIKSSDIWHASASAFPRPFCFLLKYSGAPLTSVLLLPPCHNTLNLFFIYFYFFYFNLRCVCVHDALVVHNPLTAESKYSDIIWCDSTIVSPLFSVFKSVSVSVARLCVCVCGFAWAVVRLCCCWCCVVVC